MGVGGRHPLPMVSANIFFDTQYRIVHVFVEKNGESRAEMRLWITFETMENKGLQTIYSSL